MLDRYAPGNTDVVILTHVGGGVAQDYERIAEWCKEREVFLLEDAAHALGVGSDSMVNPCAGWLGDAAVFSLYATKSVPIGEGGVGRLQTTRRWSSGCGTFCNYGKRRVGSGVSYNGTGFNFRMSRVAGRDRLPADEAPARNHGAARAGRLRAQPGRRADGQVRPFELVQVHRQRRFPGHAPRPARSTPRLTS